jgi:hypothetical protein
MIAMLSVICLERNTSCVTLLLSFDPQSVKLFDRLALS